MRTKHNELSIGISVTVATLIVVLGILLLGKSNFLVNGMLVNMTVQNAEGLGVGDDVLYRGIVAGSVQSISLGPRGVLVVLKLPGAPKIPDNSTFSIRDSSLLGGKEVDITAGTSSAYLQPNAEVAGQSQPGLLNIAQQSSGLSQRLNTILGNVDTLSGPQTTQNLYAALQSLTELTNSLQLLVSANTHNVSSTLANLKNVSASATTTMSNLNQISSENRTSVHSLLVEMNATTRQLQSVIQQTSVTVAELNQVLKSLQDGRGSLGKLMVDDSLYVEMKAAVQQFDSLVKDIKANPKKYVTVKIF